MHVSKVQILDRFNGRLPQLIRDSIFLPEGADGLSVGNPPMAFRLRRTPGGQYSRAKQNTVQLGAVTLEGYRYCGVSIAGVMQYYWVREDVAGSDARSIQVVPWSADLEFGIKPN